MNTLPIYKMLSWHHVYLHKTAFKKWEILYDFVWAMLIHVIDKMVPDDFFNYLFFSSM